MPSLTKGYCGAPFPSVRSFSSLVVLLLLVCLRASTAQQVEEPGAHIGSNDAAASLLVKAMTARQTGRLDIAIGFAQNASMLSKDNPAILSLLSQLQYENGDTESALYFAKQATSLSPDRGLARAYASMLLASGDLAGALKRAESLVVEDEADILAHIISAKAKLALGRVDAASAELNEIDETTFQSVAVLQDLVSIATDTKNHRGWLFATQWMSQDPASTEPRVAAIRLLTALGRSTEAATLLSDAHRLDPQNDQLTSWQINDAPSESHSTGADPSSEIRALLLQFPIDRSALTGYSESLAAKWRAGQASNSEIDVLGSALLALGSVVPALDVLVPALQVDVTSEERWALVGEAQRRRNLLNDSALTCTDGQLFFPGSVALLVECSMTALERTKLDDAERFIQLARRYADESPPMNPLEAKLEVVSAILAANQGVRELAVLQLVSAVRMSPRNSFVLSHAARVYGLLGNTTDALSFARSAAESDPSNDQVQWIAGRIYMDAKLYDEAEVALRVAVAVQDSNAALFELLGDAASQLGATARSRMAYERALELEPTNSILRKKLDALPN